MTRRAMTRGPGATAASESAGRCLSCHPAHTRRGVLAAPGAFDVADPSGRQAVQARRRSGGDDETMTEHTDDPQRELSAYVDETETENTTDTAATDTVAALEARLDELEAGMKAVSDAVEDTVDHVDALADRLDDVDAGTATDATAEETEPGERPNTPAFQ